MVADLLTYEIAVSTNHLSSYNICTSIASNETTLYWSHSSFSCWLFAVDTGHLRNADANWTITYQTRTLRRTVCNSSWLFATHCDFVRLMVFDTCHLKFFDIVLLILNECGPLTFTFFLLIKYYSNALHMIFLLDRFLQAYRSLDEKGLKVF